MGRFPFVMGMLRRPEDQGDPAPVPPFGLLIGTGTFARRRRLLERLTPFRRAARRAQGDCKAKQKILPLRP